MNEKILVKGRFSTLNPSALVCFVIAGIALVICFVVATIFGGSPAWAFEGIKYGYYWFFIGTIIFFVSGLIFAVMDYELIVTDGRIVGKTSFGKRVDLPISQISGVGTGIFNRVSIATSAGAINFCGVKNKNEVFSAISELLLKRQEETRLSSKASESSIADELKKLKVLLDADIITQEEFEAKKKQLLGL